MLKNRREHLEYEIRKLHKVAADLYLSTVVNGLNATEYDHLKTRVSNLQFDLNIVNLLLEQGYE